MKPAGYLINLPTGLEGKPGMYYDYILAQNGLFVRAENPLIKVVIRIADVTIRGLVPLEEKVGLANGKVPFRLGQLALDVMRAAGKQEVCLAITWDGNYHLRFPPQEGSKAGVTFTKLPHTAVEIHSHGEIGAFFSETDNEDEQGLRIYVVAGKLQEPVPEAVLRVGVYGYFREMKWEDVFEL